MGDAGMVTAAKVHVVQASAVMGGRPDHVTECTFHASTKGETIDISGDWGKVRPGLCWELSPPATIQPKLETPEPSELLVTTVQ